MQKYSENEIILFTKLGYEYLLNSIDPLGLYKIAVFECFIENKQGPEVEALRLGFRAIEYCDPYRMTPEFEKLIEITL